MPKTTKSAAQNKAFLEVRQIILKRLEELEMPALQLSQKQNIVHPVTAQAFLYSGRETSATVICEMLSILGLKIVSKEKLCNSCRRKKI